MKIIKLISSIVLLLAILLLSSCVAENATPAQVPKLEEGIMAVHFFDVGQGDSEFIQFPNGETMLIDAGETDMGETVVEDIKALGYSEITYIVATHPHSDHIGGMSDVFDAFDIKNLYLPNAISSSNVYQSLLDAVEAEGCNVIQAQSGVAVIDENNLSVRFIAPVSNDYDNLNNFSAVLKINYYENSFLFMGDAEELAENEMIFDVNADVIKVGHHGSKTSSSKSFIARVNPQYAVFEVGKSNSYGHPHEEILKRWQNIGAKILRTDENGNITITSDGQELAVSTDVCLSNIDIETESVNQMEYDWVLNTNSKKIHMPDCSSVSKISKSNIEYSDKNINELKEMGYTCCKSCNPGE